MRKNPFAITAHWPWSTKLIGLLTKRSNIEEKKLRRFVAYMSWNYQTLLEVMRFRTMGKKI